MFGAVASWNNDRAIVCRRQYGYLHDWDTAANICSMDFGNVDGDSGTGAALTRDPATGEKVFYGEYLINTRGEVVVAGIRTPKKIAKLAKTCNLMRSQVATKPARWCRCSSAKRSSPSNCASISDWPR